jgi:chemotaxis regulatin CheY-phosphate phosphatase CheZ
VDKLVPLTEDEFEHIEDTVARTAKGRAFLRRYAQRAQGGVADDVRIMLDQMRALLSQNAQVGGTSSHIEVLRRELLEMAGSIEKARREVAALQPPDAGNDRILSATSELDAIVSSTERASFDILNSAERLMDLGSKLRRNGADPEICSEIESEVSNIFTACSFQDITGQRTSKVVNALRYIEQRVAAMIAIWDVEGVKPNTEVPDAFVDKRPDAHLLNGPALEGHGVSQSDVDALFADPPEPPAPPPKPKVAAAPPPPAPPPQPAWTPPPAPVAAPVQAAAPPPPVKAVKKAAPKPKPAAKPAPPPPAPPPAPPPPPPVVAAPPPPPPPPPPAPKPAPPPPPPPAPPPPPPPAAAPAPKAALDQSAIDALFG